jgi:hypothetical protein
MVSHSSDGVSRSLVRISSALALAISVAAAGPSIARAQTVSQAESANPSIPKSSYHLQVASDLLGRVPNPVHEDAAERLGDLRQHYAAMVALYRAEAPGSSPTPRTEEDGKPSNWTDRFSDVERALTKILGSGTPLGPPTGIPVAPATASGVLAVDPRGTLAPPETAEPETQKAASAAPASLRPAADFPGADLFAIAAAKAGPIGFPDLDLEVRKLLEQFRVELELFYTFALSEGSPGRQRPTSS